MYNTEIIEKTPEGKVLEDWYKFLSSNEFSCQYASPEFFAMPYWDNQDPFAILVRDETNGEVVASGCGVRSSNSISMGLPVRPQLVIKEGNPQALEALASGLLGLVDTQDLITVFSPTKIEGLDSFGYLETITEGEERVVMLDLEKGLEAVMMDFSSTRRANIRKSIRKGLIEIELLESINDLKELYEIHVGWCELKEIDADTWDVFKRAWEQKHCFKIFVARHESRVIAGSYYRHTKSGVFEYAGNNSLPSDRNVRPNDLLMWRAIEWASENGFSKFSMGASHPFLIRFGGTVVSNYKYQLDKSFLHRHQLKESLIGSGRKIYKAIPESYRKKLKSILGKS